MKDRSFCQSALGVLLLVASGGLGCDSSTATPAGGSGGSTASPSTGGKSASGGTVVESGGTTSSGGSVASGGSSSSGGSVATGGSAASGGIATSGGTKTSGGTSGSGGAPSSGGTTSSGGASSSGGTPSSRGASNSGGASSSGGVSRSGGSTNSGGATGTGGVSNSGGIARTGGTSGSGGVTNSGGSSALGGSTGAGGSLPWLTVVGNKLQDPSGKTVILRGVSIEGLTQQMATGLKVNGLLDKITNKNDVDPASVGAPGSPGWYTKIVRLPADPPGTSDTYVTNTLKPAVDYATNLGLYAIIDLHYIDNPYNQAANVTAFWTKIAPMFATYSNVFYEVFNESNQTDTWAKYKPTMQGWVTLIRGSAPKNIIIAGSPSWDQTMGDAATNPLTGGNIIYSVHMYEQHYNKGAGYNVTQVNTAAKAVPLIMTEWGFCGSATPPCTAQPGRGTNIIGTYGTPMLNWLEGMGGSWTAWCASNSWLPDMFTGNNWDLRTGQDEMGAFVKDWMYTKKDQ